MQKSAAPRPRFPSGLKLLNLGFGLWTAAVFVFLYLPIFVLVAYSFNTSKLNIVWQGFTFKWYAEVWGNARIVDALKNSLIIAVLTTVVSVILGTTGAWLLHRFRYRFSRAIQTLVAVPMIMPEIVMGISLLILFSAADIELGHLTVILAHVTFCFPFVLVAVQARLHGLDPSLEEAALDLGATPLQAFWLVIVPCLKPAIVSGALLAFTLSMDEFIVTAFTTGPDSATLPIVVFGMAKVGLNPMLNALSAFFIAATIAFVLFSNRLKTLSAR